MLRTLLLLLVYSFLFVFFNTTDDFTSIETLTTVTVGVSLIALAWLWLGRDASASMPLGKPVLIYIAAYLITSLTSTDPRRSLGDLVFLLFALLLFSLSADLVRQGWPAQHMARAWLLAGAVVACLLWVEVVGWYQQWQAASAGSSFPDIVYRLPVPNLIAIFLNPFILAAAAFFLAARKWVERIGMLLLGGLFGGLSYLASSRASWLGIGLGGLFLLYWFARERQLNGRSIWRWLRARWPLAVVLAVVLLAVLAVGGYFLYQQTVHPTHASVADARSEYWPVAWKAFLHSPLWGNGPYTFGSLWLQAYSVPPKGFFPHAHSTLLNLLAEGGLLLTLAFAWLWWNTLRLLWKRLQTAEAVRRPIVAAALAILLAFTIQGFFDSYHHEPLGLWAMLLFLGLALGEPRMNPQSSIVNRQSSILRRPWWVLLLVAALWLNLWVLDPLARGESLADAGEWDQAAPLLQEAAARDPWLVVPWVQAGLAQANAGDLTQAANDFQQAVALDPDWSLNWANLGAVYLSEGYLTNARLAFERAAAQDTEVAEYWLGAGQAAEAEGDGEAAQAAYRQALDLRPDWREAYFWRSTGQRSAAAQSWDSTREPQTQPTITELESALAANPSLAGSYIQLGKAYLQDDRLAEAERLLQQADLVYFSDARDRLEMFWLRAEAAAQEGNLAAAVGYGEQAWYALNHPGLFGPGAPGGTVYFPIAFRRPSMQSDFVPQFLHILLTDAWGERMVQLSQWYLTLGNPQRAGEITAEVIKAIPDLPSTIQLPGE